MLAVVGFCMYFLVEELEEVSQEGISEYLGSFWNIWDLAVAVLVLTTFALALYEMDMTPCLTQGGMAGLRSLVAVSDELRAVAGFDVLFVWVKVVKYLEWFEPVR